jgi:glycerol-3-phosphate cytidylyltransferase-like family protein
MQSKEQIIKEAYYSDDGYGSQAVTLKDAKQKDPTITKDDVKQWFDENVDRLKHMKGRNSYVAPAANYEFQVDLFSYDFQQPKNPMIPLYGILAIDSFSKYVHVVPIDRKLVSHWKRALNEVFEVMGKPKVIYSDPDASILGTEMKKFLNDKGIDLITTLEHAPIAERAIRTIKAELDKRIKNEVKLWTKYLPEVLKKYNNKMVHSGTDMTPNDANKEENEFEAKTNMEIKRINNRKYPELNVGDKVRIYKKRKVFDKERVGVWEDGYRRIEGIIESHGQKLYKVDGVDRPLIRSNILKV